MLLSLEDNAILTQQLSKPLQSWSIKMDVGSEGVKVPTEGRRWTQVLRTRWDQNIMYKVRGHVNNS